MQFELTRELTDLIIFGMENQEQEFVLDSETLELRPVEEISEAVDGDDRFLPLPEWTPAHGFRLMERFVEQLHNPEYREKLTEALDAGRGVFRRFKDVAKERPEIERRWHAFRDRELRAVVYEWYNDLRETWGLERRAAEQEDLEDLVLSDFTLVHVSAADEERLAAVRRLSREQARELGDAGPGEAPPSAATEPAFVAEAPGGEIAAAAATRQVAGADRQSGSLGLVVDTLYVRPAFRGLGLGRLLLERLVGAARDGDASSLELELGKEALILDETASALGFKTVTKRFRLDLETDHPWY